MESLNGVTKRQGGEHSVGGKPVSMRMVSVESDFKRDMICNRVLRLIFTNHRFFGKQTLLS
jgi:hypothetical protein